MILPSVPENFDWIAARAKCTPFQIFEKLRLQVQDDVEKRKTLMTENERTTLSVSILQNGERFGVLMEGPEIRMGVIFSCSHDGIDVHDTNGTILYQGKLTLSNDGECKLKVEGVEYSSWQFRKLALEDVLFTCVGKFRP